MYLTIVIPTRNRTSLLSDLLDSISKLEQIDFEWEVLVIDNSSNDNTKKVVESKIHEHRYNLRLYKENRIGLHNCRKDRILT